MFTDLWIVTPELIFILTAINVYLIYDNIKINKAKFSRV